MCFLTPTINSPKPGPSVQQFNSDINELALVQMPQVKTAPHVKCQSQVLSLQPTHTFEGPDYKFRGSYDLPLQQVQ